MTAILYERYGKYQVMLSWNQEGKRKQKSVTTGISVQGKNKRVAEKRRKEILAEWEKKITSNFVDILFSDYLLQWLEIVKHSIAESTYHSYKKTIERQICPYFIERKIKLHDVKPYHIQDFYAQMMKTRKLSGHTIHHYHANIHKSLRHAVQTELIRDNPASKVVLPKRERPRAEFYTVEELRVLLEKVKGSRLETPVYLAIWFGMRRGEIVGLRWQDIDFKTNTVSVVGVMTDWGETARAENLKYKTGTKSFAGLRSFPLPPEVAEYLQRRKAEQEENQAIMGSAYNTDWLDFVCVDDVGDLIRPRYITHMFPKFLRKHGLRVIRFHDLRDSNASLLLDKGVDMKLIQSWLGHAHYSTTADIYAHLRAGVKRELGNVLSAELSGSLC